MVTRRTNQKPAPLIAVGDDLVMRVGAEAVRLTPTEGLDLAERLARAAFRRALSEEAEAALH
jgi:hypothetical protein